MANPTYKGRDDVPAETVDTERTVLAEQAKQEGKPEAVVAKMVEGRLNKFYAEICLLEQPYIKDDKKTVEQLLREAVATMGENIQIGSFYRVAIGE